MSSFLPADLDCLTATVLETISHVQTPVTIRVIHGLLSCVARLHPRCWKVCGPLTGDVNAPTDCAMRYIGETVMCSNLGEWFYTE